MRRSEEINYQIRERGGTNLVSDLDGRGVQGKQSSRSDPVVAVIG